MKKILIVIDRWKIGVFKKHLNLGGYKYTETVNDDAPDAISIFVQADTTKEIQELVLATRPETNKLLDEL